MQVTIWCFAVETHLEGSEPHQPVQSIVVRRYDTRSAVNISRFAAELVLLPNCLGVLGILAQGSLENHLCPFLGDAFRQRVRRRVLMGGGEKARTMLKPAPPDLTFQKPRRCWQCAAGRKRCSLAAWNSAGSSPRECSGIQSECPEKCSPRGVSAYLQ